MKHNILESQHCSAKSPFTGVKCKKRSFCRPSEFCLVFMPNIGCVNSISEIPCKFKDFQSCSESFVVRTGPVRAASRIAEKISEYSIANNLRDEEQFTIVKSGSEIMV